ncbi:MAG: hypothetical protein ACOYKN_18685 [Pirellula sp.]
MKSHQAACREETPRMPGGPSLPDSVRMRTTGSVVRTDDTATASLEKRALSVFPMSLTEALLRGQAFLRGKSRKGLWHMAKTFASGVGMTNDWLSSQGVLSLKTLWAELAHLRGTA